MTPQTAVMMQKMIYGYKQPLDQICFMVNPVTYLKWNLPKEFNGVPVITMKYAPFDKIYLSYKPWL